MNSNTANVKKSEKTDKSKIYAILTGSAAGLVNGVFGGGGGMIVVPMLVMLLKCNPKMAHATTMLIILPLSLVSGLFYAAFGNLNLQVAIPVTIGVLIGGTVGAFLLSKLSTRWVVVIFSVAMAAAGVKMLLF